MEAPLGVCQRERDARPGLPPSCGRRPAATPTASLLSEETRARGFRELESAGLVTLRRRQIVATDSFDFRRFRNVYKLRLDALAEPAAIYEPTKNTEPNP